MSPKSPRYIIVAALSLLTGSVLTWHAYPIITRMSAYAEAERLAHTISAKNHDGEWKVLDDQARSGKLLLKDTNGDHILLVNGHHQLRLKLGSTFAIIQQVGTF